MTIREVLAQGKPLLFDGAMGTYYASLPGRAGSRCELANTEHPEDILAIHRRYLDAGSRAVRTNTFDASGLYPDDPALAREIIVSGVRLAREAAEPCGAFVFADMGPALPDGALTPGQLYCRQAELFLSQGLRCFVLETLSTDEGVRELARYLKQACPEAFLLVSFAVGTDGITRDGLSGRVLLTRTAAIPEVDAVGFNCMSGPHHLLELIRTLDRSVLGDKFLSVMPNAGYPTVLGRRVVYQSRSEYFAAQMAEIRRAGAMLVGGCCGTTPDHIAKTAAALSSETSAPAGVPVPVSARAERQPEENRLRQKLEAGERVIAVELDPPADDDVRSFMEGVRALRDAGADAVTVSDCPVGRPRADSSLLACKIRRELGVEPLPHMTCRDRNLNATKALLLGLSIEGVHNVLLVTGDPIPDENREEVKSVFNFNSRKLIRYVSDLNQQVFTTPFCLFAALNVNAVNFDVQLRLAQEKEAAGVFGFLTQPVHSPRALENLARAREVLHGKLLGGIFPIVSHRNAVFLNNEVTGVTIPAEIVAQYEGKSREAAEELAVELSLRFAREMESCTDGLYLMTPFRRVELMRRIMEQLR
ncbi:MAG: bifunctional homocysteine S-methyltransferase/methylenetetrahydrofolate reductase [Oscillospiraceae bacterium]|nr:bifunctional homocysteine S-methyltransferase/methylenetetrahydrofolate reductase [Oscillospiraceae bacterium]